MFTEKELQLIRELKPYSITIRNAFSKDLPREVALQLQYNKNVLKSYDFREDEDFYRIEAGSLRIAMEVSKRKPKKKEA